MSNQIKKWLLSYAINQGANSSVMQSAAAKVARLERDMPEKLGIWVGAAAREIGSDLSSLMGSGGASTGDQSLQEAGRGKDKLEGKPAGRGDGSVRK